MNISGRLKTVRAALGLKQDEMSAQSGVSYRSYQHYEGGRSQPGAEAMAGFSRLGINLHWLLTGQGKMFQPNPLLALGVEIASAIEMSNKGFEELLPALELQDSPSVLAEYIAGKRMPDKAFLERLAEATGHPADSLDNAYEFAQALGGFRDAINDAQLLVINSREKAAAKDAPPPSFDATAYASIPLYDVRAAAGSGAVVDDEQVVDYLHFKQEWIRQELRASPSDLYLIHVDGESMEPTLRPGDIILVDHRDQAQARDGVYVLRLDGTLLVKRLQKLPGGIIKVTSDNPAYESFTLKLAEMKEQDFDIIGRVVWTGRRM